MQSNGALRLAASSAHSIVPEPVPANAATSQIDPFLVDCREAARLLGISERSVFALTKSGQLLCRRIGRRVLYSTDWHSRTSMIGKNSLPCSKGSHLIRPAPNELGTLHEQLRLARTQRPPHEEIVRDTLMKDLPDAVAYLVANQGGNHG